jgi:KDO2-lipid IV(A) lauroyltransferase
MKKGKSLELFEYLAFMVLKAIFILVPRSLCRSLGGHVGRLTYAFDRKHRLIALSNLTTAFGKDMTDTQIRKIARDSFVHFGMVLMDIVKLSLFKPERIAKLVSMEGEEHLIRAIKEGKGVLLFTAHFGNWEAGSVAVSKIHTFQVVARTLDNKRLEKELVRIRTIFGAKIIYKHEAAKNILQSLRRNEVVAILIDQSVLRSQAVYVDFFGKQTTTTPSLAAFHIKTVAPLVPACCNHAPHNS